MQSHVEAHGNTDLEEKSFTMYDFWYEKNARGFHKEIVL